MIGIHEYKKFDRLVTDGRKAKNYGDVVKIAFELRSLLMEILRPWGASNIAVTFRKFESGIDRVGIPKGSLIEAWVSAIFGHVEMTHFGDLRDVHLRQVVEELRKKYGELDK